MGFINPGLATGLHTAKVSLSNPGYLSQQVLVLDQTSDGKKDLGVIETHISQSRMPLPVPATPVLQSSSCLFSSLRPLLQQVLVNKVLKSLRGLSIFTSQHIVMNISKLYWRLHRLLWANKLVRALLGNTLLPRA